MEITRDDANNNTKYIYMMMKFTTMLMKVMAAAKIISHEEPKEYWSFKDFDINRFLGEEKFERVYLAREKQSRYVDSEDHIQGEIRQVLVPSPSPQRDRDPAWPFYPNTLWFSA